MYAEKLEYTPSGMIGHAHLPKKKVSLYRDMAKLFQAINNNSIPDQIAYLLKYDICTK